MRVLFPFNQAKVIESLPVDKREEAAYELVSRLFDMQGLHFTTDEQGRPVLDEGELAAVLGVKDQSKLQEFQDFVTKLRQHKKQAES